MDVVNTLVTSLRVSEPSCVAPTDATSAPKGSGKSFEDTLQSVYDAAVVAAAGVVPVALAAPASPIATTSVSTPSLSAGSASTSRALPDTAAIAAASSTPAATLAAPGETGLALPPDATSADAVVAGPVVPSLKVAGEYGEGSPNNGAAALVAATDGARPSRADNADDETKDDSSDADGVSSHSANAEPVGAPNGVLPASQAEKSQGNSISGVAASPVPATIAEQRVNASSQGSLEIDAVKAMWSEVDLSRAKNRIEASVVTAHGEVQVTARTVRGETRVAVVAPSAVVFAAGVGVEDRVRKDLLSVGIDVADIQFTNSETSPKRDHHGRDNNEKEDQDAK